jgi:hypothetical protein
MGYCESESKAAWYRVSRDFIITLDDTTARGEYVAIVGEEPSTCLAWWDGTSSCQGGEMRLGAVARLLFAGQPDLVEEQFICRIVTI